MFGSVFFFLLFCLSSHLLIVDCTEDEEENEEKNMKWKQNKRMVLIKLNSNPEDLLSIQWKVLSLCQSLYLAVHGCDK